MANGVTGTTVLTRQKTRTKSLNRLSGFVTLIRPLFFILTPVNAGSAAVLSIGKYPSAWLCLLGALSVAFASCAINVFNDYTDRERDKLIWPGRPIPSGKVRSGEALLVVLVSAVICLSIAWFVFNPLTFYILLIALTLGTLYSVYLRDRIGYLILPPIVGLIYLGGWAAFSPDTLFRSFLPWYLYILAVAWQAAHIMVYYPLHTVPVESGKPAAKKQPAFFFFPSINAAVNIGLAFTILTFLLSGLIFFVKPLGPLYLVLVAAAGVYAIYNTINLRRDTKSRKWGLRAFTSLSLFRLVISGAILLVVLLGYVK